MKNNLAKWTLAGLLSLSVPQIGMAQETAAPFMTDIPEYHEEAMAAGIDHKYTGPWEYFVGGGVASFDCSGDRTPDLFLAGGSSPARLYVNHSAARAAPCEFKPVDMGLDDKDLTKVLGAYPVDIDNDHITRSGPAAAGREPGSEGQGRLPI